MGNGERGDATVVETGDTRHDTRRPGEQPSSLGIRDSFGIRHSSFPIPHLTNHHHPFYEHTRSNIKTTERRAA